MLAGAAETALTGAESGAAVGAIAAVVVDVIVVVVLVVVVAAAAVVVVVVVATAAAAAAAVVVVVVVVLVVVVVVLVVAAPDKRMGLHYFYAQKIMARLGRRLTRGRSGRCNKQIAGGLHHVAGGYKRIEMQ